MLTDMRALSLYQPYATAIPLELKGYETRGWLTHYRGTLAIHSTKHFPAWARRFAMDEVTAGRLPDLLPMGFVLAIVELTDCVRTEDVRDEISDTERRYGDWSDGRYAWKLEHVRVLLNPVAAVGHQGLWTPDEQVVAAIARELAVAA